MYVTCAGSSSLLWAKGKVAPAKGKTLPCLELMAVFLALKSVPEILSAFPEAKFRSLNIFSDSQITLAWVINKEPKTKQLYLRNRIQDIAKMSTIIAEKHALRPNFLYVRSEENAADLLTRGLTASEFRKNLSFWTTGPAWLSAEASCWPQFQTIRVVNFVTPVFTIVREAVDLPLIDFGKFSNLSMLLGTYN